MISDSKICTQPQNLQSKLKSQIQAKTLIPVLLFLNFLESSAKLMKYTNLIIRKLFLVFSLLFISVVSANETDTQPFIKGSFKQIQKDYKGKPYIITFWSEDCAFCMKELAMFGKLLKTYQNVEIVSISTDPFLEQQKVDEILSSKGLMKAKKWVFADNYVERLYFDVDKRWRGELPLNYFFDRNNKMIKQLGAIKENELIEWLAKQNQHNI